MKTKVRLNCYFFSNLIVCVLSLNMIFNNETKVLVASHNTKGELEAIYAYQEVLDEKEVVVKKKDSVSETTTISVTKKTLASSKVISYVKPSYNSVTGANLVNYAKHYLGLRYVSAGNSLSTGTDCSGFTRLIFKEFGINLGRTVSSQLYSGSYVSKSDLQPGDLVFYGYSNSASHVAIYIGGGLIIHESNPRDGVKISSVNIMHYITARRLITANVIKEEKESVVNEEKTDTQVKDEIIKDNVDNNSNTNNNVDEDLSDNENLGEETPNIKEENKESQEVPKDNVPSKEETPSDNKTLDSNTQPSESKEEKKNTSEDKNINNIEETLETSK